MANWYFQVMGDAIGPLTSVELRERALSGQIGPETLISRDDTDQWVTADRVSGLLDPAPTPPPLSPPIPVPDPATLLSRKDHAAAPVNVAVTKEYKVLTQKDKWFSGKFDPAQLEEALNAYADQGWIVKSATTASIPGFGGNRDELVVILER